MHDRRSSMNHRNFVKASATSAVGVMNVPEQYGPYVRIGLVLLASGGCFLLSFYAKSLTEHNVFPVLFPGVVLSAWIGGRLGGLVSTVALALGTAYFHMPPDPSF